MSRRFPTFWPTARTARSVAENWFKVLPCMPAARPPLRKDLEFSGANIDHVSIQVADLQRSVDFYQKMFGFSVINQDQRLGIIGLGVNWTSPRRAI